MTNLKTAVHGKRSASVPGSCGQHQNPVGAVHKLRLVGSGVVHGGRVLLRCLPCLLLASCAAGFGSDADYPGHREFLERAHMPVVL